MLLIYLTTLTMSTNSCSAADTDLSCVFIPGGPSDLIPGTGCHTTHKTGCHGSLWSNLKYWHSTADWSLRLSVEPVCLKCHAYFVFRLFLFLEAFVCCIWNTLLSGWEDREEPFPFEHFFFDGFMFADQSQYEKAFSQRGFIYTPLENICHFFYVGLSAPSV